MFEVDSHQKIPSTGVDSRLIFVDLHKEKNKNRASITTDSYLIILKTIILDRIN